MKMTNVYLMFSAVCIAGGIYFFYPDVITKYLDTVVVAFAALAYFLFIRPWLKQKLAVKKEDVSEHNIDTKNE
ncbi:hypothetical protein [Halodesulfovibrio sp.]|uniref:hypothetical protein n=1 Tax=Halodesulfovibrio sp. TaxID=1912772 RepID=UPI0025C636A0|nr:hypothetical protein [Halodesulfovibrio sp.]